MAKRESGPGRPQGGQLLLQKGTGPSDEEVLTTSPEKNKETRSTHPSSEFPYSFPAKWSELPRRKALSLFAAVADRPAAFLGQILSWPSDNSPKRPRSLAV